MTDPYGSKLSIPFTTASGLPAGVSLVGAPDTDLALTEVVCARPD